MKYNINEFVIVKKDSLVKKIIDSEIIDNTEIYYMDDITCYPESQLYVDKEKILLYLINKNKNKLKNLLNLDSVTDNIKNYVESRLNLK